MGFLVKSWYRWYERVKHFWRHDWKTKFWALIAALSIWFFLWTEWRR